MSKEFNNADEAIEYLESKIKPRKSTCPRCGDPVEDADKDIYCAGCRSGIRKIG